MKSKLIKNFNKDLLKSLKVLKINNENLYVTSNLTKIGKIRIAKQLKLKIILDALKKKTWNEVYNFYTWFNFEPCEHEYCL